MIRSAQVPVSEPVMHMDVHNIALVLLHLHHMKFRLAFHCRKYRHVKGWQFTIISEQFQTSAVPGPDFPHLEKRHQERSAHQVWILERQAEGSPAKCPVLVDILHSIHPRPSGTFYTVTPSKISKVRSKCWDDMSIWFQKYVYSIYIPYIYMHKTVECHLQQCCFVCLDVCAISMLAKTTSNKNPGLEY